jgi:hypothetical protein
MGGKVRTKSKKTRGAETVSLRDLRRDPARVLKLAERGPVAIVDEAGKQKLVISSPIVTPEEIAG